MANSNKNVVSGLSWVKPIALTMFVVSILSLVLPALVAIIVSFIFQPAVATISLYEISEYSRGFAFGSLTLFILFSLFSEIGLRPYDTASGHCAWRVVEDTDLAEGRRGSLLAGWL